MGQETELCHADPDTLLSVSSVNLLLLGEVGAECDIHLCVQSMLLQDDRSDVLLVFLLYSRQSCSGDFFFNGGVLFFLCFLLRMCYERVLQRPGVSGVEERGIGKNSGQRPDGEMPD